MSLIGLQCIAEVIEGIAPDELQKMLTGRKLLRACRKGKHMWMELDGGAPALMFHFGVFLNDVQLTIWGDTHVTCETAISHLLSLLLVHVLFPEDVCFTMPHGIPTCETDGDPDVCLQG